MKSIKTHFVFILLLLIIAGVQAFAQEDIIIEEEIIEETIETIVLEEDEDSYNAFPIYRKPNFIVEEIEGSNSFGLATGQTLFIPDVKVNLASDEWRSMMSDYKVKRKESKETNVSKLKGNEVVGTDLRIGILSDDLMNVYTTFDKKNNGVQVTTYYMTNDGHFINYGDSPSKYSIAESMLAEFGEDMAKKAIEIEISEEEKNLKTLVKEQDKLIRENGQLHNSIEKNRAAILKAQEAIAKAEKDILDNLDDQKAKKQEVLQQEDVLEYVKSKILNF